MSTIAAAMPHDGKYAPYKHPNVGFLNCSELLLGSTHSLPLLNGSGRRNASCTSLDSAHTIHDAASRTLLDDDLYTMRLPSIRLSAALTSISDLDLSAMDLQQAQDVQSTAKVGPRRIGKLPRIQKAVEGSCIRSSFDWQCETPSSEDQDCICPLQRQPRVQSSLRPNKRKATAKANKPVEASREQRLVWEDEMRKTAGCAGYSCWASAKAGPAPVSMRRSPPPSHKHKGEGGHHFWQRLSSKLGIDRKKDVRAASDPLPSRNVGLTRIVTQDRRISVPSNLRAHEASAGKMRSFLSSFGKNRQS